VVEVGEKAVILAQGERVVLVVVALGADKRRPEPDGGRRVDPVEDGVDADLFPVGPRLDVDGGAAVGARGDLGFDVCAGVRVAGGGRAREIWAMGNWSNGRERVKGFTTQSR